MNTLPFLLAAALTVLALPAAQAAEVGAVACVGYDSDGDPATNDRAGDTVAATVDTSDLRAGLMFRWTAPDPPQVEPQTGDPLRTDGPDAPQLGGAAARLLIDVADGDADGDGDPFEGALTAHANPVGLPLAGPAVQGPC